MKRPLRDRRDGVSPVVAEILLVAITVVLAAVLYIMASGLLSSGTNLPPTVAFSGINAYTGGSYNTTFSVADASRSVAILNYKFNLLVGSTYGNATAFAASTVPANVTVGTLALKIIWNDVDGGGTLTQGDTITVAGKGASLPAAVTFEFLLFWSDGSQLAHVSWRTP